MPHTPCSIIDTPSPGIPPASVQHHAAAPRRHPTRPDAVPTVQHHRRTVAAQPASIRPASPRRPQHPPTRPPMPHTPCSIIDAQWSHTAAALGGRPTARAGAAGRGGDADGDGVGPSHDPHPPCARPLRSRLFRAQHRRAPKSITQCPTQHRLQHQSSITPASPRGDGGRPPTGAAPCWTRPRHRWGRSPAGGPA